MSSKPQKPTMKERLPSATRSANASEHLAVLVRRPSRTCRKCGKPLLLLWSDIEWQFYCCDTHGVVVTSYDG